MEASDNISAPKLQARPVPTKDQFPIYLRLNNIGKITPDTINKTIYKLFTPSLFMAVSQVNGSLDVRVRDYTKCNCHVFDEYLRGSTEYEIVNDVEFDKLYLNTSELLTGHARFK